MRTNDSANCSEYLKDPYAAMIRTRTVRDMLRMTRLGLLRTTRLASFIVHKQKKISDEKEAENLAGKDS